MASRIKYVPLDNPVQLLFQRLPSVRHRRVVSSLRKGSTFSPNDLAHHWHSGGFISEVICPSASSTKVVSIGCLSFSTACARLNIRTNSWHAREQKISLPGLQTGLLRFYLSSFHLSVHEKTGALNTRNPRVICSTLKIIQLIATCSKESGRAFLVLVDGMVFVNSQSGRRNRLLAAEELQSGRFDPGDAGNVGEKWRICRLRPHQEYDPYL